MKFFALPKSAVRLTAVVFVAVIYYSAAKLGLLLVSLPGNVTPVWPPAGIALAAILRLGYGVWPGIWLGEFLAVSTSIDGSPAVVFAVASGCAVGDALTPVLGAFLIRRFIGDSNLLNRVSSVFKFVLIGGMLIWLIAASFGTTSMCLGGIAPWSAYKAIWWTWWLGNVGGVLVFTPVLLIWSQPISNFRLPILDWAWLKTGKTRQQFKNRKFKIQNLKLVEAVLLGALVMFVSYITFRRGYPIEYMLIPYSDGRRFGLVNAAQRCRSSSCREWQFWVRSKVLARLSASRATNHFYYWIRLSVQLPSRLWFWQQRSQNANRRRTQCYNQKPICEKKLLSSNLPYEIYNKLKLN
jgi:integral membrane sensor domain MASE1